MKMLEVGGNSKKRSYLNLDCVTRLVLLEDDRIEVYVLGDYFDVIQKGNPGYAELKKIISEGEQKSEG